MSQTTTINPRVDDPFSGGMQFQEPDQPRLMPVVQPHSASDQAMAEVFTAQRVAVKRNMPEILRDAKMLATAASQKFYYSIPFKERAKDGRPERVVYVEGASIDCAMAALSIYGNCRVEAFPAKETATHWTFMARFVDYEKGVTVVRAFNQRKSQNTGMRDAERQLDIIFQIGQSKAIRNVILGALKWLTDEMFIAAKSGVLERIAKNPEQARQWLVQQFAAIEVSLHRVERIVTRTVDKWLATDMAKLFAELQSVRDGFADADDQWPTDAAEALRREQADAPPPTDKTLDGDAQHLRDVTAGKTQEGGPPGPNPPPAAPPAGNAAPKQSRKAQAKAPAADATSPPATSEAPKTAESGVQGETNRPPPGTTQQVQQATAASAPVENAPEHQQVQQPTQQPTVRQGGLHLEPVANPRPEDPPADEDPDLDFE